jgi:hypothetical protein
MTRIKGKLLKLSIDSKVVGLATSCNLTTNSVFIDSRTKDDTHPENELDYVEATITSDSIMGEDVYRDFINYQQAGTALSASVTPDDDADLNLQNVTAIVKVESVALNAPAEGYATVNATFKGYLTGIR